MYNIITKNINEIIPTEQDTFYYLKNSLNILTNTFYSQGEIYMDELHKNVDFIEIISIFGYVFIFFVLVFIYFFISYSYNGVSKKKKVILKFFFLLELLLLNLLLINVKISIKN